MSGIFNPERIVNNFFRDINDWTTEKKQLETYIVAGRDLVKIKIEATQSNLRGRASISCRVLEVNGEDISSETQELKIANDEFINTYPTVEEQLNVVKEALAKFDIHGKVLSVSKVYAEGYLRAIRIRKRIQERERRGADVHI